MQNSQKESKYKIIYSLVGKASALEKPRTWVRVLASVRFFHLFCCVLSSVLPLQSVGRSNFDKGLHNLTTLIKKTTYINENCCIIFIMYIYEYIFVCMFVQIIKYIIVVRCRNFKSLLNKIQTVAGIWLSKDSSMIRQILLYITQNYIVV